MTIDFDDVVLISVGLRCPFPFSAFIFQLSFQSINFASSFIHK